MIPSPVEAGDSAHTSRPRLRVAIVGGGIGGLALATFLSTRSRSSSTALTSPPEPEHQSNLDISIYEAAPSLTELGAGVGLWLRTWKILASARLAEDLKGIAPVGKDVSEGLQKAFEYRRGDRSPEGYTFGVMEIPFGVLTLHRADFQRALARHAIPPAKPHFGKRIVGYEYADENDLSSEIIMKFTDGSTARADLLVGADGIHSPVRREVLRRLANRGILKLECDSGSEIPSSGCFSNDNDQRMDPVSDLVEPVWSGTIAYRSLIPLEKVESRFPGHRASRGFVIYFGKNQHVIAYPISASTGSSSSSSGPIIHNAHAQTGPANGSSSVSSALTRMLNLVVFVSEPSREGTRLPKGEAWMRPATCEEVLKRFKGWEDEVVALLELAESPLAWAIHTVNPLQRYSDAEGRVVMLGDAAHAMTPHQGAGGGQAIEDAHVLASLLTHSLITRSTLPAALKAYDAVRVPISQRVVRGSRMNGMIYDLNHNWDSDRLRDGQAKPSTDGEQGEEMEEMAELRKLADVLMEGQKWEWEDVAEDAQPSEAVRIFEELLGAT